MSELNMRIGGEHFCSLCKQTHIVGTHCPLPLSEQMGNLERFMEAARMQEPEQGTLHQHESFNGLPGAWAWGNHGKTECKPVAPAAAQAIARLEGELAEARAENRALQATEAALADGPLARRRKEPFRRTLSMERGLYTTRKAYDRLLPARKAGESWTLNVSRRQAAPWALS